MHFDHSLDLCDRPRRRSFVEWLWPWKVLLAPFTFHAFEEDKRRETAQHTAEPHMRQRSMLASNRKKDTAWRGPGSSTYGSVCPWHQL